MNIPILSSFQRPMVFISSQIEVFSKERKELAKLIKTQFDYDTFLFESLSRSHPPRDVYLAGIQQSQIFIGIYGTEYGWIDEENGMSISGIHDELRIVKSLNKRRFSFILKSEKREDRLKELIEKEVFDKTATQFDNEQELYRKVIASLKVFAFECIFAGSESYDEIPDYARDLIEKYESKYIIETSFYNYELCPAIENNKRVYLYGEPGCGKTIALMLTAKKQNVIYISLRNRSLSNVLGYITNKISNILGRSSYKYTSIDDTSRKYEQLLRTNQVLLMIDDIDQNPEVAKYLLDLEIGKSKVIFSGRKCILGFDAIAIKCTGFTVEESREYVLQVAPHSNEILRNEAIEKSKGNPQYLTYYCHNSNQKPAESLESYHEKIYDQLSFQSKEILAVLSISEAILSMEEITTIISKYRGRTVTGIALSNELSDIDFLVVYQKDMVSILHPAFSEYVSQKIINSGVSSGIHMAISEIYVEPYELHFKIYHVVCAGNGEKVYSDLPNAELNAYLSGFIHIARKLFAEDILISRRKGEPFRLGFAIYHTALIKNDRHGALSGLNTAKLAQKIFSKAQKSEWSMLAESMIATCLVNLSRGSEAIAMLKKLALYFKKHGLIRQEAVVRTNLSYAYSKLGKMDELESECLEAKKLHESIGDMYGVAVCLLNLNNVYVAREENGKILSTCREIQKLAKKFDIPRLEAGAQNGLTVYYRRKKLYDKAEEAVNKSISIAKQLDDWDCVATNYGNLGNVFRDQKKFPEAKNCHRQVMDIGRKRKSTHHIAHAKGRLAEIAEDEGDEKTALQLGEQSIELWNEVGNVYEGASEKTKQAERILRFSGFNWKDAVKLYEEAIDNYFSAGLVKDAYYSYLTLIDIHLKHIKRFDAAEIFQTALSRFATSDNSHYISNLLNSLRKWEVRSIGYIDISFVLQESIKCFSDSLNKAELFELVRNITSTIKLFDNKIEDTYFTLIESIIGHCQKKNSKHYITALALVIEQMPMNIGMDTITEIFEKIGELNDGISYRHEKWLDDQWYIFFNGPNAPIIDIRSGNTTNERIVAALTAILTLRQKEKFEEVISIYGWKRIGLLFQTLDENECRKHDIPIPNFERDWPIMIPGFTKDEYRNGKFTPILVGSNYIVSSDHRKYPNNKNIICLNLQLINEIVPHFTRQSCPKKKLRKFRTMLIPEVFDVSYKPDKK